MDEIETLKLIIQHKDETIKILSDILKSALENRERPDKVQGWTVSSTMGSSQLKTSAIKAAIDIYSRDGRGPKA